MYLSLKVDFISENILLIIFYYICNKTYTMENLPFYGTLLLILMLFISIFGLISNISPGDMFGHIFIYFILMGIGGLSCGIYLSRNFRN